MGSTKETTKPNTVQLCRALGKLNGLAGSEIPLVQRTHVLAEHALLVTQYEPKTADDPTLAAIKDISAKYNVKAIAMTPTDILGGMTVQKDRFVAQIERAKDGKWRLQRFKQG